MSTRDEQILRAAWSAFSRYGLSKTTMADIAREAGVARQTLYNAYAGKDDVFRAVVRMGGRENIERVRAAWVGEADLPAKLEHFLTLGPIAWYDMAAAMPDVEALLDGFTGTARAEMEELAVEWAALLAEALQPHADAITASGSTVSELAEFVHATAKGAKYNAPSRDVFLARLKTLRASVLMMTGHPADAASTA